MLRKNWTFSCTAKQLHEAADIKVAFHSKQLKIWLVKRKELIVDIKKNGAEVLEKIVLAGPGAEALSLVRDWSHGGEILVRQDLRKALEETYEKLQYHTKMRDVYDVWAQIMKVQLIASKHQKFDTISLKFRVSDPALPINSTTYVSFLSRSKKCL